MGKQNRGPVATAVYICVAALLIMIISLLFGKRQVTQAFAPPAFDETAISGTPVVPEELGWQELDANVFKASVCGAIELIDGTAEVWLTSPESNTVWLKLRVLDADGNILGETGLIRPGEYVRSVCLNDLPSAPSITLKIMAYEPDTYHSAGSVSLSTKIS